jgi:hypothetical protein
MADNTALKVKKRLERELARPKSWSQYPDETG